MSTTRRMSQCRPNDRTCRPALYTTTRRVWERSPPRTATPSLLLYAVAAAAAAAAIHSPFSVPVMWVAALKWQEKLSSNFNAGLVDTRVRQNNQNHLIQTTRSVMKLLTTKKEAGCHSIERQQKLQTAISKTKVHLLDSIDHHTMMNTMFIQLLVA